MTDELLIEELSFPAYRRVSTVIFVPGQSPHGSAVEMVTIDPRGLQAAQDRDNAMPAPSLLVPTVSTGGRVQQAPTRVQTRDMHA